MKKSMSVLSLFAAGLMVLGGAGLSHAGDLKISGFADILYFVTNEAFDVAGGKNALEQQFVARAEVDFEKEEGPVTFRLDLDFPGSTSGGIGGNLAGSHIVVGGGLAGAHTFGDTIEQAKFDWVIPSAPANLTLTGGIFNTPIGYELQDATDRTLITFGQLFVLLPINHAGIELSASQGPVSASVLYVDEWRSLAGGAALPTAEENSYGGTLSFNPMPEVGLSIGYLTSEQNIAVQDEDVLDVIVSGAIMPTQGLDLNYALEYVMDENNNAYGITVGAVHNGNHGLTLRYDRVDCDAGSAFCGAKREPKSITVGVWADIASSLTARLEWSSLDSDTAGPASETDAVLLQFVAKFM